jgi:hypothetical protein
MQRARWNDADRNLVQRGPAGAASARSALSAGLPPGVQVTAKTNIVPFFAWYDPPEPPTPYVPPQQQIIVVAPQPEPSVGLGLGFNFLFAPRRH